MARIRKCCDIEPGDEILGDHDEPVVVERIVPMGGARVLHWTNEQGVERSRMLSHFQGLAVPGEADQEGDPIRDILEDRHPFEGRLGPPIPRAV